jgi:hypothetical protein
MKVKAWLAAEETLRRIFSNRDECFDEIEGADKLLDIRRAELVSIKQETDEAQDERTRVQAALCEDQARFAAQVEKNNDVLNRQQEQIRANDRIIKDQQAKNDNLIAGFNALTQRLKL